MNPITLDAVTRQVEAMGAELFEVGLFKPATGEGRKEPEMLPRTWDVGTLLRSVPWLKHQNAQGRNIYIRPKGEHPLSLVDDLTAAALDRMRSEGFAPAVVVETSPGNFQAWLNHGRTLPKSGSTLAARTLAERFGGDKGAADWRHYGRLAGFTNRKPQRRSPDGLFPYVRLISAAPGLVYPEAERFVAEIRSREEHQQAARTDVIASSRRAGKLLTIEDFRANPRYGSDGNRIDLAYAVYALSHGVPDAEVRAAVGSRDLTKKGNVARQKAYVDRTVVKAAAFLDSGLRR